MNALTTSDVDHSFAAFLPRDMREETGELNWTTLQQRFCAATGPIRLGSWKSSSARGGRTTFDATFGLGDSIHAASATTYGPIDALTSMLYDAGFHIEIVSFHQQPLDERTVTFVLTEFDGRRQWSMAVDSDCHASSIRAVIGAANMLHS
ncbi:alpha-isopropylmalate synthase regulatory domain-containing protein [Rhodococcus sp. P1Y]|uniref:alpha-isopropylmalate synthase regulatory domain-containing protein n=1 Tax=Rhodococcus sp. P1Y TaxID=1302308 RepID=UPI000EB12BA3|nr:alpha-isopropylmalate synthase regulatory domain-containing protein [Rhodococcus sp. P1Y]AYJ47777.1 2-isopropylmalate synthase [Rhodococcus sp. P1Y]